MNENDLKRELGLRIKSFRKLNNYTQESLGALIGLEPTNLSNIELGKSFPSIQTICALINKAKIEPNYLFGFLTNNTTLKSIDYEIIESLLGFSLETKIHCKNLLDSLKK